MVLGLRIFLPLPLTRNDVSSRQHFSANRKIKTKLVSGFRVQSLDSEYKNLYRMKKKKQEYQLERRYKYILKMTRSVYDTCSQIYTFTLHTSNILRTHFAIRMKKIQVYIILSYRPVTPQACKCSTYKSSKEKVLLLTTTQCLSSRPHSQTRRTGVNGIYPRVGNQA